VNSFFIVNLLHTNKIQMTAVKDQTFYCNC